MVTIKKNHRILEFKQEPFLKLYIECNTDLRREARKESNKVRKKAKLRNNAIFGKSIANLMNNVDVKIGTTRKQYLKRTFRPTFKREKRYCN